jgi:hypothetical protein
MQATIFREYAKDEALRSDRSAGDRRRHREKVRGSIRENLHEILDDQSIIGSDGKKIIKVPIRGVKEYRFVYGDNTPGVGQGDGNAEPGQVIGKAGGEAQGAGKDKAGDQPGVDYYETDVTLEEILDLVFEDLELPDMERKILRQVMADRVSKRKGYRKAGIRIRLDKKRTAINRIRRQNAAKRSARSRGVAWDEESRFPYHQDDMVFKHMDTKIRPESNAVVLCIMDTSGSMDTMKKYLARSFFLLLYHWVRHQYRQVEIVFIAHHTEGCEVTEEEFFHKGESGGTFISSGYHKALEIIRERYHPALWNIYAFHCSDGDNFESDNPATLKAAQELCDVCNLFGYGEIKPLGASLYESSMLKILSSIEKSNSNFQTVLIEEKKHLWPAFAGFLKRERLKEAA